MAGFLRDLRIRTKLLIALSFVFIFSFSLVGVICYSVIHQFIETNITRELALTNTAILNMVKTAGHVSIKNHLRAVADRNREIVSYYYSQNTRGLLTLDEAKQRSGEILLSQLIGKTGYIFVWDISRAPKSIPLAVHPKIQGQDVAYVGFVQKGAQLKNGYIEYAWKNPGEPRPRDKSMYLSYFKPWEWVIAASSYKDEFMDLIDVNDIKEQVLSMKLGATGYPFVINSRGDIIIHPKVRGNYFNAHDANGAFFIRDICRIKDGTIYYTWKNPGEKVARDKIAVFNYIPEFDWIVCTSGYIDEIYSLLYVVRNIFIGSLFCLFILAALLSYRISASLIRPLQELMVKFQQGYTGDFSARMNYHSSDEIGRLGHYFNIFMEKLQEYSNSLHEEILGHKRSEAALRESEERYRSLSDNTPDIIYETDRDLNIVYLNKAGFALTGFSQENLDTGLSIRDFLSEIDFEWTVNAFRRGTGFLLTHRIRRRDGSFLIGENNGSVIFDGTTPVGLRGSIRDVTEKSRMEEQILQSQKMETIGTLAGGLAHDFNNVLAGITSTLSIIRYELGRDKELNMERLMKHLDLMERSGRRATEMVQQLLSLSRKRETEFSMVDLNLTIENVMQICEGSFDKSIDIRVEKPAERALVQADPTQIEQVLLNLCVNANHAMTMMRPAGSSMGGRLLVSLEMFHADGHFCAAHHEAGEIDYWKLSVRDSGVGMDSSTISKIFMPFYTTKEKGSGTGLGLSMVYNLVHQHKGFIDLYSEPGVGTTFNVYLPVLHFEGDQGAMETEREVPHGEGLILVVDDEEVLRDTARSILEQCGYTVITADDGEEGVRVFREAHREISGVLLDLVMPKKSGDKAYLEMKKIAPKLKVLLASGFKQDERVEKALTSGINGFIQKPYTMERLAWAMADLLAVDSNPGWKD